MPNSLPLPDSPSVIVTPATPPPDGQAERRHHPAPISITAGSTPSRFGFVGHAFTYANATALGVLILFFFRMDSRQQDNTLYMREREARQEARADQAVARDSARTDRMESKVESLSSEVRSLSNAVTSLASEVRASRQKAEADRIMGELRTVYREVAPMPRPSSNKRVAASE